MVAAVTASSSAVAKGLAGDRNKFPIIACWIQCELQHAMSDVITNFAVGFDGAELVKGRAACTDDKLPDALRICPAVGILWRKSFVNVLMARDQRSNAVLIQNPK